MVGTKKVYKWYKRSIKGFLFFFIVSPNVDFDTYRDKFIAIIDKRRKKPKCLIFRFRCNDKN